MTFGGRLHRCARLICCACFVSLRVAVLWLVRADSLGQTGMSEFVVFPFSGSKDQRRQVHALLREMCPDFVSDTVVPSGPDDPDGHRIRVWHKDHRPQNQETRNQRSTKRGRGRGRGRGREREHDNVGQNRNNSKSQRTKHGLPVFQERRDKWAHPETEYLQFVLVGHLMLSFVSYIGFIVAARFCLCEICNVAPYRTVHFLCVFVGEAKHRHSKGFAFAGSL